MQDRTLFIEVLEAHNIIYTSDPRVRCKCGWEGSNHPTHVADMYEQALREELK